MIDYLQNHAITIMMIVVLVLAAISAMVLIGALYSRWILNITKRNRTRKKEKLSECVVKFISGDSEVDDLRTHLHVESDYRILLEIINDLTTTIDGPEKERIADLLDMEPIREYYTSRFYSKNRLEQAKACLYFARQKSFHYSFLPKILEYTGVDYPMLSYAAAMAVVVHGNEDQKRKALKNQLLNENLSDQAINDLFVEYQNISDGELKEQVDIIIGFLKENNFSPARTALLIKTLGELNYHESAEFLVWKFLSLPAEPEYPDVAETLINYMPVFATSENEEEILNRIHTEFSVSEFSSVREACAKVMGVFMNDVSKPILMWMLYDKDFYVRYYAAKSLVQFPGVELSSIKPEDMEEKMWRELVGEVEMAKEQVY